MATKVLDFDLDTIAEVTPPDISHLITEDDTPVDNIFSERQQRLLVDTLYSSWRPSQPFVAMANVGLFGSVHRQAIVPDALLSLDVHLPRDFWAKQGRSYFIWEYGKPPDVVIEVVSNKVGDEAGDKLLDYARLGIPYYVIYDPHGWIMKQPLNVYELTGGIYVRKSQPRLERVGLRLRLWQGEYEQAEAEWLRWCDPEGELLATGAERAAEAEQRAGEAELRAEDERQRAEDERQRAEDERQRAEDERQRAERLLTQLRALGVDPEA